MTRDEIKARSIIAEERFITSTEIELRTLLEMTSEYFVPSAERQISQMAAATASITSDSLKKRHLERVAEFESTFTALLKASGDLRTGLDNLDKLDDHHKKAAFITTTLILARLFCGRMRIT